MSEDSKKNILDEIKKLDESKQQYHKNISEIEVFSEELKKKLGEEDINIQNKLYQATIDKEKIKNENELNILTQQNEKMEKYIQLLAKQYELELQYIEQYCDYKSKVEKIGEKYAHININNITPLKDLFSIQLNGPSNTQLPKKPQDEPQSQVKVNEKSNPPTRRNTIATISENNPVKNDIRNTGNLQDHLKNALTKRFQNTGTNDD
tara:strand:- start:3476 stop:4096 length:621 start_codon:yes stop_codon:yes gene_type:complete